MRLLLDARWMRPQKTGVGVYCQEMVKGLVKIHPDTTLITHTINRPFVQNIPAEKLEIPFDLIDHPGSDWFEQWSLVRMAKRKGFTHFVSFEGRIPHFHSGLKTISVVHDISSLRIPGSHGGFYSAYLKWCLWNSQQSADMVLVVSETVKKQFQVLFPKRKKPVEVVYNGPTPWPPIDSGQDEINSISKALGDGFFLAVGMTNPRKNMKTLAQAYLAYRSQGGQRNLVVTGNVDSIRQEFGDALPPGLHLVGYVDDGKLRRLHESSLGLIYPSLDEGFGIPPIDAAQMGKPVICSDIPVFHEILGEYPHYFPPMESGSLVEKLLSLEKAKPSEKRTLPREYAWELSAKQMLHWLHST